MNIFNTLRYVEIETCSSCTRKCKWCLFGCYPDNRPIDNQLLETDVIEMVLEDLKRNQFDGMIALYSINEPLLDTRIQSGEIIYLCKKILGDSAKISLTSNGDLLNKTITRKLFSCGLDRLKISCYDDKGYEKAQRIRAINEQILVLDQRRYTKGECESNRGGSIKSLRNLDRSFSSCYMPQYRTVVGWDGQVRLCPHEMLGKISLGNVYEKMLSEILMNKQTVKLRTFLKKNRKQVYPCNLCNIDGSEHYMKQHVE